MDWALAEREEALKEWQDLVKKYEHPVYHLPNYTAEQEAEVDAAKLAADTSYNAYLSAEASYKTAMENQKAVQVKAESALKAAQDQVDTASGQYQAALAQLNLKMAPGRSQDLRIARNQIKQAQASLESIQNKIEDATLKAPFKGTVVSISGKEGEFLSAGGGLATGGSMSFMVLSDLTQPEMTAEVDETDVGRVKVGQAVHLSLDAYPNSVLQGKVKEIGLTSLTTRAGGTAFKVKISITPHPDVVLRIGMNADADIVTETRRGVVTVPSEAVVERGGKSLVFVVENSVARPREVKLGLVTADYSEIRAGLKVGERIVTKDGIKLRGGERVRWARGSS